MPDLPIRLRYPLAVILIVALSYSVSSFMMQNIEANRLEKPIKNNELIPKKARCNYPYTLQLKHAEYWKEYPDNSWFFRNGFNEACKIKTASA